MKAPWFWKKGGCPVTRFLLSPFGMLYGLITKYRMSRNAGWQSPRPVICIGNLVAGGAGKTPVVIDLAKRIQSAQVLSRGYGGSERGPVKISSEHIAAQVGDEPILISSTSQIWVSDNRQAGCQAAIEDGAKAVILDDGFQDPSIKKDLSLIVVDGGYGFGNGHCIPAGPLREGISNGLSRADAVVIIGDDTSESEALIKGRCPVLHATLVPNADDQDWQHKKVVAFAGIGHPEKFFQTLRDLDCTICETVSFADHHPFTQSELDDLKRRATQHGATLVTTQKDLVRIAEMHRDGIEALAVRLEWQDVSKIEDLLARHII
ncbi:MAG: tetraacyldisaccharide 4'-kinase [Rhodospirillaceae bacterium]|jgi:tetraacyldisaccharide 4'-kinase|nr:tetraacyldisaccharide 4'-kinase [Rhodospirillaceae bacterium]